MTLENLTERQRNVFDFIVAGITRGIAPTVREIASQFGITSPNGVMCHLKALERRGLIRRDANKSRCITLVNREKVTNSRERVIQAAVKYVSDSSMANEAELTAAVTEFQG